MSLSNVEEVGTSLPNGQSRKMQTMQMGSKSSTSQHVVYAKMQQRFNR